MLVVSWFTVAARVVLRVAGLVFGGCWDDSYRCGFRARLSHSGGIRSFMSMALGGRGASNVICCWFFLRRRLV